MTEWLDSYDKQLRTGSSFDKEVAKFNKDWDIENRQYQQKFYQQKTQADAKRYQESSMPWVVRAGQRGVQAAAEGIGAPIVAMFDSEVGEHMVRGTNAEHQALMMGVEQSGTNGFNGWLAKNLYGTAYSFSMAAAAAGMAPITGGGSLGWMAGTFATSEAYGSYVEAIDEGLSESKAKKYAATQGALEAIPMLVFSALGIGGAEKWFKNGLGGVGREMFKGGLAGFGKDFVAEIGEEEITTLLQVTNRFATLPELKGQDPWEGGTDSPMFTALQDTFTQTAFMMGFMKVPAATKFLMNPSRATAKALKETAPTLYSRLEETHGDLDVKENRDAAAAATLEDVSAFNETIPGLERKLEQLEDAAADPKYASDEKQEQIQGIRDKLTNRKTEAEGSIKELMELYDELISEPVSPKPPNIDAKLTPDTEAVLPDNYTVADPEAEIVQTADLPFGEPEAQEQVRILRLIKELSRKLRGRAPIHFVKVSGRPEETGAPLAMITEDGIFITVPHLDKYMDRGILDSKAMRKALAGAFSHEFFGHELRDNHPEIWNALVEQLKADPKYRKLLEKFRSRAHANMEGANKRTGFYTRKFGKDWGLNKDYHDLLEEEAFAYLLSEHFADTGLISKIADLNPTFMEKLGDWLRRIGKWLYRDKLYLGLTETYNSVIASRPDTDGAYPVVVPTDPIASPVDTPDIDAAAAAVVAERDRLHEVFAGWSYRDLQNLAKKNGIKANQSRVFLMEALEPIVRSEPKPEMDEPEPEPEPEAEPEAEVVAEEPAAEEPAEEEPAEELVDDELQNVMENTDDQGEVGEKVVRAVSDNYEDIRLDTDLMSFSRELIANSTLHDGRAGVHEDDTRGLDTEELIEMGLVESEDIDGATFYFLTSYGKKAWSSVSDPDPPPNIRMMEAASPLVTPYPEESDRVDAAIKARHQIPAYRPYNIQNGAAGGPVSRSAERSHAAVAWLRDPFPINHADPTVWPDGTPRQSVHYLTPLSPESENELRKIFDVFYSKGNKPSVYNWYHHEDTPDRSEEWAGKYREADHLRTVSEILFRKTTVGQNVYTNSYLPPGMEAGTFTPAQSPGTPDMNKLAADGKGPRFVTKDELRQRSITGMTATEGAAAAATLSLVEGTSRLGTAPVYIYQDDIGRALGLHSSRDGVFINLSGVERLVESIEEHIKFVEMGRASTFEKMHWTDKDTLKFLKSLTGDKGKIANFVVGQVWAHEFMGHELAHWDSEAWIKMGEELIVQFPFEMGVLTQVAKGYVTASYPADYLNREPTRKLALIQEEAVAAFFATHLHKTGFVDKLLESNTDILQRIEANLTRVQHQLDGDPLFEMALKVFRKFSISTKGFFAGDAGAQFAPIEGKKFDRWSDFTLNREDVKVGRPEPSRVEAMDRGIDVYMAESALVEATETGDPADTEEFRAKHGARNVLKNMSPRVRFMHAPMPGESNTPPYEPTASDIRTAGDVEDLADRALQDTEFKGRGYEVARSIFSGSAFGAPLRYLRKHNPRVLMSLIDRMFPDARASGYAEHLANLNKEEKREHAKQQKLRKKAYDADGISSTDISDLKIYIATGRPPKNRLATDISRTVIKIQKHIVGPEEGHVGRKVATRMQEAEEFRFDDAALDTIDPETRKLYSQVKAARTVKNKTEMKTVLEQQIEAQLDIQNDGIDKVADMLVEIVKRGDILSSVNVYKASIILTELSKRVGNTKLTPEERDVAKKKSIRLISSMHENKKEWGRAGVALHDPVDTIEDRQRKALFEALYSPPDKIMRKIAKQRAILLSGSSTNEAKLVATAKIVELQDKWQIEAQRIDDQLAAKGWDLEYIHDVIGNREAIEQLVILIKEEKGDKSRYSDISYEIFVNNILSGIQTHSANFTSNTAFMLYEFGPKRAVEALLNTVIKDPSSAQIGEMKWLWAGMMRSMSFAAKNFMTTLATGRTTFEESIGREGRTKADLPLSTLGRSSHPAPLRWAGKTIKFIGTNFLTAADEFGKTLVAYSHVSSLAYREAKAQGLKGEELAAFIHNVLGDKSNFLWQEAANEARRLTFQEDLPEYMSKIVSAREAVPLNLAKFLFPFMSTTFNLFKIGVSYSPVGITSLTEKGFLRSFRKGMKDGDWTHFTPAAAQQLIAWVVGLWILGMNEEEEPFITGSTEEWEAGARATQQRSGTPMSQSVKFGDWWWSYSRIEPFATAIALITDTTNAIRSGDPARQVFDPFKSVVDSAANKTFLRTVGDLALMARNFEIGAGRMVGNYATAWVPNLVKQGVRAFHTELPERRIWGKGEDRFRLLGRRTLERAELGLIDSSPRYDMLGRKIPTSRMPWFDQPWTDIAWRLFVPIKTKDSHPFQFDKLLRRWNTQNPDKTKNPLPPSPSFKIDGETQWLSPEQYEEYQALAGSIFRQLTDAEAIDVEQPTEQFIDDLATTNWTNAKRAAREMLSPEFFGGDPDVSTAEALAAELYTKNINKRLKIISRSVHTYRDLTKEDRKKSPERKRALILQMRREQGERIQESIRWLKEQGVSMEEALKVFEGRSKGRVRAAYKRPEALLEPLTRG